ncbi:eukaryotic translation initiation factor 3 subunit J [Chaetomium strumarium]|uniref:Eukaryotic translation initiation factor 3 subunit J n=1 Tax=Chaetomium strumarium TaxID=1170767 RepID=A0AAJ0GUT8_9PEZI|nr:eukaryotic translation initiation factor 3 subunit J [Chaetomium strumarium]
MPGPNKRWEDEEESDSAPNSPVVGVGRRKFDDEEASDNDVLDSWDAEDSEVEREKAKKAAEAKAKAEAEAAAAKKSKAQRIAERQAERAKAKAEAGEESEEETEAQRRERLRRTEKESDLKHAEDLFADIGISSGRKGAAAGTAVPISASDPNATIDLATLPIFNPTGKAGFEQLSKVLGGIIGSCNKKPHYTAFVQQFTKELLKDMPSDQIKKVTSTLTALGNEKMKEEKAAEKGGKKSKAAKTKTSLAGVSRGGAVDRDVATYDDEAFDDDDFM